MSVILTGDEAAAFFAACEAEERARAAAMPDTVAALRHIVSAQQRLRDLGWREGIYCPKDGRDFAVVEIGSTGIFTGSYAGEWSRGQVFYAADSGPAHKLWWKPLDALTPEEDARRLRCDADERANMERIWELASMTEDPAP